MELNHAIAVIIRLFAIGVILYVIRSFPSVVLSYLDAEYIYLKFYLTTTIIAASLIAVLLWIFPNAITKKIVPNSIKLEETRIEKDNFLSFGLILLGVYFLYYAVGDIIYWGYVVVSSVPLQLGQKLDIFITIVEFIIALFLIFGSRGLSNIILKLRER